MSFGSSHFRRMKERKRRKERKKDQLGRLRAVVFEDLKRSKKYLIGLNGQYGLTVDYFTFPE